MKNNENKKWFTTVEYYDADGTQLKLLRSQIHKYKIIKKYRHADAFRRTIKIEYIVKKRPEQLEIW